ncbi:MAG: hypothetical protein AAFV96_07790, partial [Pseudomonadota bacterium]
MLPKRIMIYCHDLFGLGNVQRMLQYCHHLRVAFPGAGVLFVMGGSEARLFSPPSGLDVVKLPEITRGAAGAIQARALGGEVPRVLALRRAILRECATRFEPDLMVIDKKPRGAKGELGETLAALPWRCARILVCRDILDAPARTRREMAESGFAEALRAEIDQVQVLGERAVFDMAAAYGLPADIAPRLHYTGYIAPCETAAPREAVLAGLGFDPARRLVFVTVGGGEDGEGVLDRALTVAERGAVPAQMLLLTGPMLASEAYARIEARAAALPDVRLMRQSSDVTSLIAAADAVVSMVGYNSVCAILAAGKPAVLLLGRLGPWQQHRGLSRGEDRADRVVAGHRHD